MDVLRGIISSDWVTIRQVFEAWSLEMPLSMTDTFVLEDGYSHAYDASRSISLTSLALTDNQGRPVSADELFRTLQLPLEGDIINELPPGLLAWAASGPAIQPARASTMLQGMIATDGRVLLVTITSDDVAWARQVWLSIRHHPTHRPN